MSESERAYCRVCGEGCDAKASFCADRLEKGGVIDFEPPKPESFWATVMKCLRRLLRTGR